MIWLAFGLFALVGIILMCRVNVEDREDIGAALDREEERGY